MLVADVMTKDPTTVGPDVHVLQAMERLRASNIRRMPVITEQGSLAGIVTAGDLQSATPRSSTAISIYDLNQILATLKVQDVMTIDPITIAPDATIEAAASLLDARRISGLPVIEDEKLVGIITITDVLRSFVGFLGEREGGVRLTLVIPDEPGALALVAQAAAPSNIVAAVTTDIKSGETRQVVVRVRGRDAQGFEARLSGLGIAVVHARTDQV